FTVPLVDLDSDGPATAVLRRSQGRSAAHERVDDSRSRRASVDEVPHQGERLRRGVLLPLRSECRQRERQNPVRAAADEPGTQDADRFPRGAPRDRQVAHAGRDDLVPDENFAGSVREGGFPGREHECGAIAPSGDGLVADGSVLVASDRDPGPSGLPPRSASGLQLYAIGRDGDHDATGDVPRVGLAAVSVVDGAGAVDVIGGHSSTHQSKNTRKARARATRGQTGTSATRSSSSVVGSSLHQYCVNATPTVRYAAAAINTTRTAISHRPRAGTRDRPGPQ